MDRTVVLPAGWTSIGSLPSDEALSAATSDRPWSLKEDLWQARSANDRFTLDVGWYPEFDPTGRFVCLVVEGGSWETPSERFETRSAAEVAQWVRSILPRYSVRY
jgi:hypothetical protein